MLAHIRSYIECAVRPLESLVRRICNDIRTFVEQRTTYVYYISAYLVMPIFVLVLVHFTRHMNAADAVVVDVARGWSCCHHQNNSHSTAPMTFHWKAKHVWWYVVRIANGAAGLSQRSLSRSIQQAASLILSTSIHRHSMGRPVLNGNTRYCYDPSSTRTHAPSTSSSSSVGGGSKCRTPSMPLPEPCPTDLSHLHFSTFGNFERSGSFPLL